jgi:murein DD-endopeptidase MepM/ murein hydrolase activator NlpD
VVTSAFVGAGLVAMGASATLPDAKTVNPNALSDLDNASAATELAERSEDVDRSSRDEERSLTTSLNQQRPDVWLLPLKGYRYTSPYGMRWGKLHAGVDLAIREGTPFRAVHAGTVTLAKWYGGYGNCVIIDHGNGTETVYGHASGLLVREGQKVQAGDPIGLVGNTGHSYGSHLHFEVHINGVPRDPIPWMRAKGVDLKIEVEAIYGGVVAS